MKETAKITNWCEPPEQKSTRFYGTSFFKRNLKSSGTQTTLL